MSVSNKPAAAPRVFYKQDPGARVLLSSENGFPGTDFMTKTTLKEIRGARRWAKHLTTDAARKLYRQRLRTVTDCIKAQVNTVHDDLVECYLLRERLFKIEMKFCNPETHSSFKRVDKEMQKQIDRETTIQHGTKYKPSKPSKPGKRKKKNKRKSDKKTWAQRDAELAVQGGEVCVV